MHAILDNIERYAAPRSLAEALRLVSAADATMFAGGTDVMPQLNAGRMRVQPLLMNLRHVSGLEGLAESGGVVRIGALVTITELLTSPLIRMRLPALWQACDHFASDQIRNAATLGGNVCNASPAGDTLPPLLAVDAQVVLARLANGSPAERRVPLREFFTGPGRTCRSAAEILTAVEIPAPPAGLTGAYYKHGTRPGLDIATISIAVCAVPDGGVLRDVRVAFGAVAPTPLRAPRTAAALEGRAADGASIAAAVCAAQSEVSPISDVRASAWYRRELIGNMLKRVIENVGHH